MEDPTTSTLTPHPGVAKTHAFLPLLFWRAPGAPPMALFSLQGPLPNGPLGRKGRSPTPTPMKPWSPLDGMMLSIAYSGDVPAALVEVVEHHARGQGLSLQALEVIGASLDHVEAFIVACEDGDAEAFLVEMGLMAPRERVALARWQAERLFG